MCGMSAVFSALFGTPVAAAIFPLEVISIGVLYYAALVPCIFSSFIGVGIARYLGIAGEHFESDGLSGSSLQKLRESAAKRESVPPDYIVCGNGAADLIYTLVLAEKPKQALLCTPSFSEYEKALRTVGCKIRFHKSGRRIISH